MQPPKPYPYHLELKELEKVFRIAYGRRRGRKLLLEQMFLVANKGAISEMYDTAKETIRIRRSEFLFASVFSRNVPPEFLK